MEWSIPATDLYSYIYVADSEKGNDVMMGKIITESGDIIDVEITSISDDFSTVTVTTETAFGWAMTKCFSFTSLRAAYLELIR